ncbi:MAG TPA: OmpH family outer membrane protein [Acidobacteriota bacterium]|nr:OmpH family outer membrane protein [Acidobacteriota bacterium]
MESRGRWLFVFVIVVIAAGAVRGSLTNYQAKRKAILEACEAERRRLSPTALEEVRSSNSTPEIQFIHTARLKPGGVGQLIVKGKFVPGTKFLLVSDSIAVVNETLTTSEYRATVKAPVGIGPETADVEAFAPVTAAYARGTKPAVVVTGKFQWEFKSANGWRVKAIPGEDTRGSGRDQGHFNYRLEFFRGAETAPFERRPARLGFDPWSSPPFTIYVEEEVEGTDLQARMQELAQRISLPNISNEERAKLMQEIQVIQQKMVAQLSDMNAMQRRAQEIEQKRKEFGCRSIQVEVLPGGDVRGTMSCGELVGRNLTLTGTLKLGVGPE